MEINSHFSQNVQIQYPMYLLLHHCYYFEECLFYAESLDSGSWFEIKWKKVPFSEDK